MMRVIVRHARWYTQVRPELGMTKESYLQAVLQGVAQFQRQREEQLQHQQQQQQAQDERQQQQGQGAGGGAGSVEAADVTGRVEAVPTAAADVTGPGSGRARMLVKLLLSINRKEGAQEALDTVSQRVTCHLLRCGCWLAALAWLGCSNLLTQALSCVGMHSCMLNGSASSAQCG